MERPSCRVFDIIHKHKEIERSMLVITSRLSSILLEFPTCVVMDVIKTCMCLSLSMYMYLHNLPQIETKLIITDSHLWEILTNTM